MLDDEKKSTTNRRLRVRIDRVLSRGGARWRAVVARRRSFSPSEKDALDRERAFVSRTRRQTTPRTWLGFNPLTFSSVAMVLLHTKRGSLEMKGFGFDRRSRARASEVSNASRAFRVATTSVRPAVTPTAAPVASPRQLRPTPPSDAVRCGVGRRRGFVVCENRPKDRERQKRRLMTRAFERFASFACQCSRQRSARVRPRDAQALQGAALRGLPGSALRCGG